MKGVVLKSTGRHYLVRHAHGVASCTLRGKLRTAGLRTTNPVAVGDNVVLESDDKGYYIASVEPRSNYIVRKSVNLSHEAHVLASNIDLLILVVSLKEPPTSRGFADRVLVNAEAYGISAMLAFNKVDLLDESELPLLESWEQTYDLAGYPHLRVSARSGQGLTELKKAMQGRVCLLAGHSGVGKSSLANALDPMLELRTAPVSEYHSKGTHTTTFAEMHHLSFGANLIDTPGIKGFGLVDMPRAELHHYFPEFFALLPSCRFKNCLHLNEPGCAVIDAVETGAIAGSRYESYLSMYHEEPGSGYR
jgi:ribosome biogenesis GTPase